MNKTIRDLLVVLLFSVSIISVLSFKKKNYVKEINIYDEVQNSSLLPEKIVESVLSPQELSRHFPDQYIPVSAIVNPFPQTAPVEDSEPQVDHNLKYISTITQSGKSLYYFKKIDSGRLVELELNKPEGSWVLIKTDSDYFTLKEGESIIKVQK